MTGRVPVAAVRRALELLIGLMLAYVVILSLPNDRVSLLPERTLDDAGLAHRIMRQEDLLAADYLAAGAAAEARGQFIQAAEPYRKATVVAPSVPGFVALVRVLVSANSIPQARAALDDALARFPTDPELLRLQGDLEPN